MAPIQFYLDDEPLAGVAFTRAVPGIGEGITLEYIDRRPPSRYRVVDVDRGYVQAGPKGSAFKESTIAVYLIDSNDPRRERP